MGEPPKRRLPLLPSDARAAGDEVGERPPWHWSGIGAVAVFLVWLPLSGIATAIVSRLAQAGMDGASIQETAATSALPMRVYAAMILLHALGFVVAAMAGGCLVGRFGDRAGTKEAAVGGFIAAATAWALAASQGAAGAGVVVWALLLLVLGGLGASAAFLGGRLGLQLRGRKP